MSWARLREDRARFYAVAGGAALLIAAFVVATTFRLGGDRLTVSIEDLGEAVAAFAAAVGCQFAAQRSTGRMRIGWRLLALSAASWGVGEVVWSYFEVGLQIAVPFPSAADLGFIGAVPLAAAAILAFPSSPRSLGGRSRALIDGSLIALSLVFMAWAFGLNTLYRDAPINDMGRLLAVLYPAADIALLTLLGLAIQKAAGPFRIAVLMLIGAYTSSFLADTAFAYLMLRGDYGVLGSYFDTGWIIAFAGVGLAGMWPAWKPFPMDQDEPVELWQLATPWIGVLAVVATAAWLTFTARAADPIVGFIGSTIGLLFVISQAMALNDSLRLLRRSRAAEAQVAARTELMTEMITRAPVGIGRFTSDLRVIDANPRLCEMLAMPQRALVGARLAQFLSPDEYRRAEARTEMMRTGKLARVELDTDLITADGRTLWAHRSVTPVFAPDGQFSYFLAMFEDITAKHEAEQTAAANFAAAEKLSRLKSEFMSFVGHEFRTALTGIQGYSEVLTTDEVSPEELKEFAGDINSEAQRMNRMITEMLDLDRIEAGRIAMHVESVDLNQLLFQAVERAQMTTEHHVLRTSLDQSLDAVQGDRDRLTQVVANLLSNAIKYSPGGGEIMVTSQRDGSTATVSVRDHGQGIPPEFIGRIFGRYERYEGNASQVVGTGLGLAIAQQIIKLHNGRIWVESKLGEGSDFRFTIPLAASGAAAKVA